MEKLFNKAHNLYHSLEQKLKDLLVVLKSRIKAKLLSLVSKYL